MKISIVTPSYNQADFLEETMQSIWQKEGDFELEHIVMDGGSTDRSTDILEKYNKLLSLGKFRPKCKSFSYSWVSEHDGGQSDALNKGFEKSTGEILGWLNSDDIFLSKDCLSAVHTAFKLHGFDIILGNAKHLDGTGDELDLPILINKLDDLELQKSLKTLYNYNFIIQPSCLFRRSVWEEYGINTKFNFVLDWAF